MVEPPLPNPTSIAVILPPRRFFNPSPGEETKKSASRVERSRARWMSMNPPAAGLVRKLSQTAAANTAATQASTALPPSSSMRAPARALSG